jgi:hypothetical protein
MDDCVDSFKCIWKLICRKVLDANYIECISSCGVPLLQIINLDPACAPNDESGVSIKRLSTVSINRRSNSVTLLQKLRNDVRAKVT